MTGGERSHEAVVATLRPHARFLFWPSVALVVVVGLAGYLTGSMPEPWMNVAVPIAAAVLAILVFVIPLLTWLGRTYTITTRRLVLRSGTLVRMRQELLHSRGYDVTVRRAALQFVFGSGDVLINTGLERPIRLRDVPNVNLVQSALHDLMEASSTTVSARRQQEMSRPHGDRDHEARDDIEDSEERDSRSGRRGRFRRRR